MLDVVSAVSHEDDCALGSERAVKRGLQEEHITLGVDADVVNGKILAAKGLVRLPDVLVQQCLEVLFKIGGNFLLLVGRPASRLTITVRVELVSGQANLLFLVDKKLDDREDTDRSIILLDAGYAQLAA